MKIEEIKKWLKDKSVRMWKRALFWLCDVGEPKLVGEVGVALGVKRQSAYRMLRRLEIHHYVKSEKKSNRLIWNVTERGKREIRKMKKKGLVPSHDRYVT